MEFFTRNAQTCWPVKFLKNHTSAYKMVYLHTTKLVSFLQLWNQFFKNRKNWVIHPCSTIFVGCCQKYVYVIIWVEFFWGFFAVFGGSTRNTGFGKLKLPSRVVPIVVARFFFVKLSFPNIAAGFIQWYLSYFSEHFQTPIYVWHEICKSNGNNWMDVDCLPCITFHKMNQRLNYQMNVLLNIQ